jgi:hypothetical protein
MLVEDPPFSPIENPKPSTNTMLPAPAVAINFHSGQSPIASYRRCAAQFANLGSGVLPHRCDA